MSKVGLPRATTAHSRSTAPSGFARSTTPPWPSGTGHWSPTRVSRAGKATRFSLGHAASMPATLAAGYGPVGSEVPLTGCPAGRSR